MYKSYDELKSVQQARKDIINMLDVMLEEKVKDSSDDRLYRQDYQCVEKTVDKIKHRIMQMIYLDSTADVNVIDLPAFMKNE